jgi:hypothetical protein
MKPDRLLENDTEVCKRIGLCSLSWWLELSLQKSSVVDNYKTEMTLVSIAKLAISKA